MFGLLSFYLEEFVIVLMIEESSNKFLVSLVLYVVVFWEFFFLFGFGDSYFCC